MMPLSLFWSFAGVVSKPPKHCPSCVKRCRCAYTGGTWLLRCCQLLLHLFLATCNKRAPDCSGASQCLLPHPQPLSYYFFLSEPVSLRYDKSCLLPVSWYNWKVSFHFKNVLSEEHLFLSIPMLTFNIITILLEHSQPDISRSTDPFFSKTAMRFDSLRRYLCICAVIQKEAYL